MRIGTDQHQRNRPRQSAHRSREGSGNTTATNKQQRAAYAPHRLSGQRRLTLAVHTGKPAKPAAAATGRRMIDCPKPTSLGKCADTYVLLLHIGQPDKQRRDRRMAFHRKSTGCRSSPGDCRVRDPPKYSVDLNRPDTAEQRWQRSNTVTAQAVPLAARQTGPVERAISDGQPKAIHRITRQPPTPRRRTWQPPVAVVMPKPPGGRFRFHHHSEDNHENSIRS